MSFSVLQSFATDDVDLGSDHRVVCLFLRFTKASKTTKQKTEIQKKNGNQLWMKMEYHICTIIFWNSKNMQHYKVLYILNAVEPKKK